MPLDLTSAVDSSQVKRFIIKSITIGEKSINLSLPASAEASSPGKATVALKNVSLSTEIVVRPIFTDQTLKELVINSATVDVTLNSKGDGHPSLEMIFKDDMDISMKAEGSLSGIINILGPKTIAGILNTALKKPLSSAFDKVTMTVSLSLLFLIIFISKFCPAYSWRDATRHRPVDV